MNTWPSTDLVILAGGKARRMNGVNKLLQQFDSGLQLLKIVQNLQAYIASIWINSHRDAAMYQQLLPQVQCYADDEPTFLGPVMGMKSAWTYVQSDYVLFIPCDIIYIPKNVLMRLHQALHKHPTAHAAYVSINHDALYPFCLMKRASLPVLTQQINAGHLSVKQSLQQLNAQMVNFNNATLFVHSINSLEELQQYQQLCGIDSSQDFKRLEKKIV